MRHAQQCWTKGIRSRPKPRDRSSVQEQSGLPPSLPRFALDASRSKPSLYSSHTTVSCHTALSRSFESESTASATVCLYTSQSLQSYTVRGRCQIYGKEIDNRSLLNKLQVLPQTHGIASSHLLLSKLLCGSLYNHLTTRHSSSACSIHHNSHQTHRGLGVTAKLPDNFQLPATMSQPTDVSHEVAPTRSDKLLSPFSPQRRTNRVGVQVGDEVQICVVMVGLPARGKSLIAAKGK